MRARKIAWVHSAHASAPAAVMKNTTLAMTSALEGITFCRSEVKRWPPSSGRIGSQLISPQKTLTRIEVGDHESGQFAVGSCEQADQPHQTAEEDPDGRPGRRHQGPLPRAQLLVRHRPTGEPADAIELDLDFGTI